MKASDMGRSKKMFLYRTRIEVEFFHKVTTVYKAASFAGIF